MRITALSATDYQEEELLQLLPEPDSLWGSRRLHHMDVIEYSGGSPAPATGAGCSKTTADFSGDFVSDSVLILLQVVHLRRHRGVVRGIRLR